MNKVVINEAAIERLKKVSIKYTEEIVKEAVEVSKELCPVDTGSLRNSIDYAKVDETVFAYGSDKEYVKAIEFGTRYTSAQPFLRPSIAIVHSKHN